MLSPGGHQGKSSARVSLPGGHTCRPVTAGLWEPLLPGGQQHPVRRVKAWRAACGPGAGHGAVRGRRGSCPGRQEWVGTRQEVPCHMGGLQCPGRGLAWKRKSRSPTGAGSTRHPRANPRSGPHAPGVVVHTRTFGSETPSDKPGAEVAFGPARGPLSSPKRCCWGLGSGRGTKLRAPAGRRPGRAASASRPSVRAASVPPHSKQLGRQDGPPTCFLDEELRLWPARELPEGARPVRSRAQTQPPGGVRPGPSLPALGCATHPRAPLGGVALTPPLTPQPRTRLSGPAAGGAPSSKHSRYTSNSAP